MSDDIKTQWERCKFALARRVQLNLASVERRAAAVASAREIYNKQPASLHWYGSQFGSDAYEALMNLATEAEQTVKCSIGTSEEHDEALRSLQTAKEIVVDISALA